MRDLKQEALKVPVANRVRKTATRDHTIDITTSLLLLRDGQLQQQLRDCVSAGAMGSVQWDGSSRWPPVHCVVKLLVDALVSLNAVWWQRERVTAEVCRVYQDRVYVMAAVWRTFKWTVPTWVHWVFCHSTVVFKRWGGVVKIFIHPQRISQPGV